MKTIDREIQEAIEIGKANQRTTELVRNWCSHVSIKRFGGVGPIEQQTGLPIGMRLLTCPHARNAGSAAMDLERVALEFHDHNCVGCANRAPVGFPNLSEIVGKRDERRAHAQEVAAQEVAAERAAVAARADRRRESVSQGDTARRSILQRIDELDDDPTPERSALLLENVHAVPEKFDQAVQDALFALIDAGSRRAVVALEALSLVAKGTQRLADAALGMLARNESPTLAADAVGDRLRTASVDQITAALPALFELAAPLDGFTQSSDGNPGPLLDSWAAAPAAVREFMGRLLGSEHKHPRTLGIRCAGLILAKHPSNATEFVGLALHSVGKPDDSFGPGGAASEAVATLVASALRTRLDDVDALLQREWLRASDEQRAVIVRAYAGVLERRGDRELLPSPAVDDRCFERIVGVVSTRRRGESLDHAIGFLRAWANEHSALVGRHAATLLGAAALLLEDAKERYSPLLDPRPSEIKALESRQRQVDLHTAVGVILELLGGAGAADPKGAGSLIVATLENAPEERNDLRAALVRALGPVGQSRDGLALVVPYIYAGLMARATVVRAAAASAYGEVARRWADDLPLLMHQSFLLLLHDEYIIVHAAAVGAVRRAQLPTRVAAVARRLVRRLIDAYRTDGDRASLLADCVETFLSLPEEPLPAADRSVINTVLASIPAYRSGRLLARHARVLEGVPEFADAVTRALREEAPTDSIDEELFRCVSRLPRADVERLGADLLSLGADLFPGPGGMLEKLVETAARAEAWSVCEQIAAAPLATLEDVPRDRLLRRIANVRLLAVRIEAALARGDRDAALRLIVDWRTARAEVLAERPDLRNQWPLLRTFEVRADALQILAGVAKGEARGDDLARVASALDATAVALAEPDARRAYAACGQLVGALAHFVRWAHAVRSAEPDADRFLRAGKQIARDLRATLDPAASAAWSTAIAGTLAAIGSLTVDGQ